MTPISTTLPAGFRATTLDPATGHIWALTRTDVNNSVVLDDLDPATGQSKTVVLSDDGSDWLRGAVTTHGGVVWAVWGSVLVSYDPSTGSIDSHEGPWKDAGDGRGGRAVDLASAPDGSLWVAVVDSQQLFSFTPQDQVWTTVALPDGDVPTLGTRVTAWDGHVALNVLPTDSSPKSAAGNLWLVPKDSVVLHGGDTVYIVSPGTISRFAASDLSLQSQTAYKGTATPSWAFPMALGAADVWMITQGYMTETLVGVDLKSGQETSIPVPVVKDTGTNNGILSGNSDTQTVAIDPQVTDILTPGDAHIWVITGYAGGSEDAYPAAWAVS